MVTDGTVLAVVLVLAWVLPLYWPHGEPAYPTWPGSIGFCAVAGSSLITLRWACRHRLTVIAATTGVTIVVLLVPGSVVTFDDPTNLWLTSAAAGAPYGAELYRHDRRRAWIVLVALTLVVARPWAPSWTTVTNSLFHVTIPVLFGMYLVARRALVEALTQRAERAERERHLLAERARTEERTRLAAEMHDIVTHRITLMVLHSGALRVTEDDPETRRIAEEIRGTGSTALAELRDLIGVLRAPRQPETTVPSGAPRAERAAIETDGGSG